MSGADQLREIPNPDSTPTRKSPAKERVTKNGTRRWFGKEKPAASIWIAPLVSQ